MLRKTLVVILSLWCAVALCQTAQTADRLFQDGKYSEALKQYQTLLRTAPNSSLYQYRTARCLQQTGQTATAIPYFRSAASRYPLAYYYLAICCRQEYLFTEAIDAIDNFLAADPTDQQRLEHCQQMRQQCALGDHYLKRVADIDIIDSQTVRLDSFLTAMRLSDDAGTLGVNSGHYCYTNQRGDQTLFGGQNDRLWRTDRLLDTWSEPTPLPIDSMPNANYPFLMPDGITLYFAAQGQKSMGGYDIFVTQYNSRTDRYLAPENIGFPYNSIWNDYMLAIDENNSLGYWATDRYQTEGNITIYTFRLQEQTHIITPTDADSLILAAKGIVKQQQKAHASTGIPSATNHKHTDESIAIAVYDNVVYHSVAEFKSDSARQCYLQMRQTQQLINTLQSRLDALRKQYSTATAEHRQTLAPAISNIEQDMAEQHRRLKTLRHQMQAAEKAEHNE